MSEPQDPDPIAKPEDRAASPSEAPPDANPPDPLLDTGSFIDPDRNDTGAGSPDNQQKEQTGNVELDPGAVIAAEPISMLRPGEASPESTPRSARRRDPEEMGKKPSWLPEDWKIELRVRASGATAGLIDRYYVEPSGQRKFRSKIEVLNFLETGSKKGKSTKRTPERETTKRTPERETGSKKRKSNSETEAGSEKRKSASETETGSKKRKSTSETDTRALKSPASQEQKKSSGKRKKSEAKSSDITDPPRAVNGVESDSRQETDSHSET